MSFHEEHLSGLLLDLCGTDSGVCLHPTLGWLWGTVERMEPAEPLASPLARLKTAINRYIASVASTVAVCDGHRSV